MRLKGKNIDLLLTGSHCTYEEILAQIERLKEWGSLQIHPIASETVGPLTPALTGC